MPNIGVAADEDARRTARKTVYKELSPHEQEIIRGCEKAVSAALKRRQPDATTFEIIAALGEYLATHPGVLT